MYNVSLRRTMKLTTSILAFGIVFLTTSDAAFLKPKSLADRSSNSHRTVRNVAETSEKKGKIVALQLINTITDTKIVDLEDGLVIAADDIEGLTRPSFNILAIVEDDDEVQSVVFGYKGDDYQRIEYEPYAFCGNDGNNFNKCPRLTYGNHTVTATPYSEVSAEGEQGETFSVSFSIVQSTVTGPTISPPSSTAEPVPVPVPVAPVPIVVPVPVPRPVPVPVPVPPVPVRVPTPTIQVGEITALELINSNTDTKIMDLTDGTVIAVSDIEGLSRPAFNIKAIVSSAGMVRSVKYVYNRFTFQSIENAPGAYAFCGNNGTNFKRCRRLVYGNHTVTATPYTRLDGRGQAGNPYEVSFSIVPGSTGSTNGTDGDVSPPKLTDLTALNGTKVDVTEGRSAVTMEVVIQDDGSGFKEGYIAAYDERQDVFQSSDSYSLDTALAGEPLTFVADLVFLQTTPTGNYTLELYLVDAVGNEVDITSDKLESRSLPNYIEVINDSIDLSPPKLLEFAALSSTAVNATGDDTVIKFKLVVQDSGSGFRESFVEASFTGDDFDYISTYYQSLRPISGEPVEFNVTLEFSQFEKPGEYEVRVSLVDDVGNYISFDSDELEDMNFTSMIEIVNSQYEGIPPVILDIVAINSTTANITSGSASIELQIVAKENGSGVSLCDVSGIIADSDDVLPTLFGITYLEEPLIGNEVLINVTLYVSEFTKPGNYSLQVTMYDVAGNDLFLASDELEDMNLISRIDVVNSEYEGIPPVILDIVSINSTTVNVTNDSASIELLIFAKENGSGIRSCEVSASISDNDDFEGLTIFNSSFFEEPLIGSRVLINVSLSVPRFSPAGNYSIQVNMYDVIGNGLRLSSNDLEDMDFPSVIQVLNDVKDDEAPELLDFAVISSTTVNVTNGPSTLELQFSVRDDVTGVRNAAVTFSTASYSFGFDVDVENEVGGEPFVFNYTFDFGSRTRAGKYNISIQLYDAIGNDKIYDSNDLEELGFPSMLTIINTNKDFDPPMLINLVALSPTTVDVSDGPATVELQVTVQDDDRGFRNGTIELWEYDVNFVNISYVAFAVDAPSTNSSGIPLTFNVTLPIPQYIRSNEYSLQVTLLDAILNAAYIYPETLKNFMFVSEIIVENTNEDLTPPEIVDVIFLSSTTLNVSSGPATFDIQIVAKDGQSGIRNAAMYISTPNDYIYDEYTLDVPIAGQDVTFNLTVSFKQGFAQGEYAIFVGVQDGAYNAFDYDPQDLSVDFGVVGSVTVEN